MKILNNNSNSTSGFSTIEILIAFSVGIVFLTSAMMVSFSDPTLNRQFSLESGHSSTLDTILDTNALSTSTNSLGGILAKLSGNWGASVAGAHDTTYTTTPIITDVSPCMKSVENVTTWNTLGRNGRTMTFGSGLSNMTIAQALGRGGCDPTPESEWDRPESDSLAEANVGGADNGTGVVVASKNGQRYAFITSNPTGNGTNKKEFTVIEVNDSNIQNLDIKATLPADKGLLGLAVVGNYAYILNNATSSHLQIIDLTNPESPTKLSTSFTLPNITCTYHNQNCQRIARSIAYYNGYLYIGTGYMAGNSPEFHIFCIGDGTVSGCSATTPVSRGYLNLDHNINDIAIKDNYAYLATSAEYAELTVIDVANKTTPLIPPNYNDGTINNRKFDAPSVGGKEEDGMSVYVLGLYAYLGREKVSNKNSEHEFFVLNISDPTSITAAGSMNTDMNTNNSYISKIYTQGKTAFISTTDSNNSFYIVDVKTASNPHVRNTCGDLHLSQVSTSLTYNNNQIFLVNDQGSALLKIFYDNGNACVP
jgi:hypothetical protein